MGQYNLGSLNSSGTAIRVVAAGDPETLILNHSTKNTVYIGGTNAVGSGNLLDATPLDPYASIVVNGTADVWAVAAIPTQPAVVYTYQNAINWTPKAVQPNIVDPTSPFVLNPPNAITTLTVPPGAQGLFLYTGQLPSINDIVILGVQSGIAYYQGNPNSTGNTVRELWVPVLSDADTQVTVQVFTSINTSVSMVWIMNSFLSGTVKTDQVASVNISQVTAGALAVTIPNPSPVSQSGAWNVGATEQSKQMFANQEPIAFDSSLASGATLTLLPASAGVQYFLHGFRIEFIGTTSNASYAQLQDTTPTVFANFNAVQVGTAANQFQPPFGDTDFNGSPIPINLGVQLKNNGSSTTRFIGTLRYSK